VEHGRATLLTDGSALAAYLGQVLAVAAVATPRATAGDRGAPPPRAAGVLIPLYARDDQPHLLFTRRSPSLAAHSGEISFPGGSRDPDDPSLADTALREAHEELGIVPDRVQVLGQLAPVFTVVSNFLITPFVGWMGSESTPLAPNPAEVAEVIEAPLTALVDPAIFHVEQWTRYGVPHPVYFYDYGPYRIWGATARVLHQLLELLPPD
jgi:8-oxo-dGTP pyrophosphatase MutT (NUDIX family)